MTREALKTYNELKRQVNKLKHQRIKTTAQYEELRRLTLIMDGMRDDA